MKTIEKRDYIHSHLHQADEVFIQEMYQKMVSIINVNDPVVGYNPSGEPVRKSQLVADLKEAEKQIEQGDCITLEELEKESEKW